MRESASHSAPYFKIMLTRADTADIGGCLEPIDSVRLIGVTATDA